MTQTVDRIPVPDELPKPVVSTLKVIERHREGVKKTARAIAVCEAAVSRFLDLDLHVRVFAYDAAGMQGKARSLKALVPLFRFLKEQGWPPTPEHEDSPEEGTRQWHLRSEKDAAGEPLDADVWLTIAFKETSGATCRYEVVGQKLADVTELVCYDEDGKRIEKPTTLEVPAE